MKDPALPHAAYGPDRMVNVPVAAYPLPSCATTCVVCHPVQLMLGLLVDVTGFGGVVTGFGGVVGGVVGVADGTGGGVEAEARDVGPGALPTGWPPVLEAVEPGAFGS